MATYVDNTKHNSDWLKWEEDGLYSRENALLAANSGVVNSGTVVVLSAGKITPMATGQGANAVGVIMGPVGGGPWPNSAADQRVVYIARHAEVADKALQWKAGVLTADKTAAMAALAAKGILPWEAV